LPIAFNHTGSCPYLSTLLPGPSHFLGKPPIQVLGLWHVFFVGFFSKEAAGPGAGARFFLAVHDKTI